MRDLSVNKLHQVVGGRLRLATLAPRDGEATAVRRVVTDSRQVAKGDVFWALSGTRFDGASFVEEAFSRGASGAVSGRYLQPWPGCWGLQVDDPQRALESLAAWTREQFAGQVVVVTGSVGKTTTRQMIHAVLRTQFTGSASPKNYNNHVGLPLSMLAVDSSDQFAVYELAASGPGEIGRLAALCRPQIGVITRVGDAHLGGFGSLEAVAAAKTELLEHLPADGGAVIAGDDVRLRKLAARSRARVVTVGRRLDNDVVADNVHYHSGELSFTVDGTQMSVGVWGRHHLTGALAAVAVGRMFGIADAAIAAGLSRFQPPPMRCQIRQIAGATIIDDTYNASPTAMTAALELLRDFDAPGRRIVVCGDMRELGEASEQLHAQLGDEVVTVCGADLLVACGDHAQCVVEGARAAGMPHDRAFACSCVEEILNYCPRALRPGDVMLIKGSRALAMERLVAALASGATCAA